MSSPTPEWPAPLTRHALPMGWRTPRLAQRLAARAHRRANQAPKLGLGGGAKPPADEDFSAARTRREISEANMAEMRERELAGQLIRVDAVRASGARTVATARDALLQIPHRMTA